MIKTILIALLLSGCITGGDYSKARVVRIDECQYIVTDEGSITHKGNCDNPIHKEQP